jgi:hypothetical protein
LGVKGIGIELEIYGDKGVNDEKGYLRDGKDIISRGKLHVFSCGKNTN